MSRINFRQGLVRYAAPHEGPPFLSVDGDGITITVTTIPVRVTFAQRNQDYLFEENQTVIKAWGSGQGAPGSPNNNMPFDTIGMYYLYWDIDFKTGIVSYDYTTVTPTFGTTPPSSPATDHHWFDTNSNQFITKVWERGGWVEKLRVFAGSYTGGGVSGLAIRPLGTQISVSGFPVFAGYILYDDANLPVQRFQRDQKGVFIHTEMPLASQWSKVANFKLEGLMLSGAAIEPIGKNQPVAFFSANKLCLARNTDPSKPAIGVASEDMVVGEVRPYIPYGYVTDPTHAWNNGNPWDVYNTQPVGTPLFVSDNGELTTSPPQINSLQQIATIVDEQTIYVQPQTLIHYG